MDSTRGLLVTSRPTLATLNFQSIICPLYAPLRVGPPCNLASLAQTPDVPGFRVTHEPISYFVGIHWLFALWVLCNTMDWILPLGLLDNIAAVGASAVQFLAARWQNYTYTMQNPLYQMNPAWYLVTPTTHIGSGTFSAPKCQAVWTYNKNHYVALLRCRPQEPHGMIAKKWYATQVLCT